MAGFSAITAVHTSAHTGDTIRSAIWKKMTALTTASSRLSHTTSCSVGTPPRAIFDTMNAKFVPACTPRVYRCIIVLRSMLSWSTVIQSIGMSRGCNALT